MLELARILDAIDRNKSFEAAAKELHRVRSALTYTIHKHEQRLDLQIFDRSEHRAKFTPAGRVLLEQGRKLLQLQSQMEQRALQTASGWEPILRVAYEEIFNTDPLLELIDRFKDACPNVDLHLTAERLNGCPDALLNHRADIAIGLFGQFPPLSEFGIEEVGIISFVFVVAPTHPLAKCKQPLTPEQITEYTAIVAPDTSRHLPALSFGFLSDQQRITLPTMELKRQAQIRGIGVGYMPMLMVAEDIKAGRLIKMETTQENPVDNYHLAWNKKNQGKAQQWFIKEVQNKDFCEKLFSVQHHNDFP